MKPLLLTALLLTGCATVQPSRALTSPADYQRLGLTEGVIAPWEDGQRTTGGEGTYEWWYTDAHLQDGSTLVVVFYTKSMLEVGGPLQPVLTINLDRPDGTTLTKTLEFPAGDFSASKEHCDVTLGKNRLVGDLSEYRLHVDTEELKADLSLVSTVKPWRAAAGVLAFGEQDEKYFAWLPAVPEGTVTGTLAVGAAPAQQVSGSGYHDHNWGNAPIIDLMHDWYWGRARVGDYTVIASHITAEQRYGSTQFPLLLVAKGDQVLVQDSPKVTFTATEPSTDAVTGKPLSSRLVYDAEAGGKRYRITFQRKRDLLQKKLIEALPKVLGFFAGLAGFDGAYLRFTGDVTVEVFEGAAQVDAQSNNAAVWELMYLGKTR